MLIEIHGYTKIESRKKGEMYMMHNSNRKLKRKLSSRIRDILLVICLMISACIGVVHVAEWVAAEGNETSKNAPLAQLVEQLTLNQWVQGSSP